MRLALACAALLTVATSPSHAQNPSPGPTAARPSFDVASIKRSQPGARGTSWGTQPGGRWTMVNRSVGTMIREAYPAQARELIGAPSWVTSDPYDVDARAGSDVPREQIRLMLQTLLAERFKLKTHYETRELPVYALVITRSDGKPGPGLLPSKIDCEAVNAARRAGRQPEGPVPANGAPPCAMTSDGASIRFGGLPLSRLPEFLGEPDGRVIIDRTGLTGGYEFTLRYSNQPNPADDTPSLFTALDEQLGLKLVPDRAPLQVLVVDSIERPAED